MAEVGFDAVIATPVGPLGVRLDGAALAAIEFLPPGSFLQAPAGPRAETVVRRLQAYFADPRTDLDLPLVPKGTPFQRRVWQTLREIPLGRTLTYGQLAARLATSARAVGGACRANPCPLVVPCHRVVAAHGPGGFAGAMTGRRLEIKTWLLHHEGAYPQ